MGAEQRKYVAVGEADSDAPLPPADEGEAVDAGVPEVPDPDPAPSPRWHSSTKIVGGVGLAVAALGAVYLGRNALTLIALAGLVAFLVAPLIRFLQRRARFPKVLALLTSYALAGVGVLLVGGLVVTGIVGALSEIDPPQAVADLRVEAVDLLTDLRMVTIGGYDLDLSETVDPLIRNLETSDALDTAGGEAGSPMRIDQRQLERLAGGLVTSVQTVGGFLAAALVTVLVALYLSADSHTFHAALRRHVPEQYTGDAQQMSDRLGAIWRGYLYGQLVNSLATGLLVWLVLYAVGLPGAFVFGLIMALLNMIPTFGPIIAAVPGILAAFALGSTRLDWENATFALLVIGIYVVVVQVQANFMAPFITGRAVSMSPATILVGLVVGFHVGGLVGSLLVVPVLASLKAVGKYVIAKLLDRDPFAEEEAEPPASGTVPAA
ncbi:hypothetical protein BH23ACT9_BH23ACT9_21130 [soil metagenome]